MSKRSSKSARSMLPAQQTQGKKLPTKPGVGAVRPVKPANGHSAGVRVHKHNAPVAKVNFQTVKIVAAVLGLLCLAGAVGILFTVQPPHPAGVIIEVVLLGLIAGLCSLAALRTEDFVQSFQKLVK